MLFNWIFNAIDLENHTALGRSDLEVETGNRRWIFEFKFAKDEEEVGTLLEQAVEQRTLSTLRRERKC